MVKSAERALKRCSADETLRAINIEQFNDNIKSAAAVLAYARALQAAVAAGAGLASESLTKSASVLRLHLLHLGKDAVLGLGVFAAALPDSGRTPTRCATTGAAVVLRV
jgi:hypothetical protein